MKGTPTDTRMRQLHLLSTPLRFGLTIRNRQSAEITTDYCRSIQSFHQTANAVCGDCLIETAKQVTYCVSNLAAERPDSDRKASAAAIAGWADQAESRFNRALNRSSSACFKIISTLISKNSQNIRWSRLSPQFF